jgi:hypothetical protein
MNLAVVREMVLARASIERWATRAGFRRGNGKRLYCGFHEDRKPSASIQRNRVRCWSACGRSWNVIDLAMVVHALDYVGALKLLATEVSVPWPDLYATCLDTEAENRDQQGSENWRIAKLRRVEDQLIERKLQLAESEPPDDDTSILELTNFEQELKRARGQELLHLYRRYRAYDPDGAVRDVQAGDADVENARVITDKILALLGFPEQKVCV